MLTVPYSQEQSQGWSDYSWSEAHNRINTGEKAGSRQRNRGLVGCGLVLVHFSPLSPIPSISTPYRHLFPIPTHSDRLHMYMVPTDFPVSLWPTIARPSCRFPYLVYPLKLCILSLRQCRKSSIARYTNHCHHAHQGYAHYDEHHHTCPNRFCARSL